MPNIYDLFKFLRRAVHAAARQIAAPAAATAVLLSAAFFAGCAGKNADEIGQSDAYYLEKISTSLRREDTEAADEFYGSMQSEHVASPLLQPAVLMLARGHLRAGEYLLADFYLEEFSRLFGSAANAELIGFLRARSSYYSLALPGRNQQQLLAAISAQNAYLQHFAAGAHAPLVESMRTRLQLAELVQLRETAALYERMGEHASAKILRAKAAEHALAEVDFAPAKKSLLRKLFE